MQHGSAPRGFSEGGLDLGKRVFRQGFSSPEDLPTAIIRTDGYRQGRRSAGIAPVHKILNPYGLVSGRVDPRARALPAGLHAANQRANVQASALSAYVENRKWNGSFS
jgi:hypothetical protein